MSGRYHEETAPVEFQLYRTLRRQTDISLGRLPDTPVVSCNRTLTVGLLGSVLTTYPRSKLLDQIRALTTTSRLPADLWSCAIRRGHSVATRKR